MKKRLALAAIALILIAVVAALNAGHRSATGHVASGHGGATVVGRVTAQDRDAALSRAFERHERDVVVEGEGTVSRVLPDDREGSRHQRFILRLASGQTVLVAHNIDIARRIASLEEGDTVAFRGEYVWNAAGGVVHWTHGDPAGRHPAGWIKHQGETYR